jgi:hypothetical protein
MTVRTESFRVDLNKDSVIRCVDINVVLGVISYNEGHQRN